MAATDSRTPEQIRREIETERGQLADAVESLRDELGEATNIRAKLSANLPAVAGAAAAAGFVLAGGVGATMRLLARRGREGDTVAKTAHFRLVHRD